MTRGRHSHRMLEARSLGSALALTLAAFLPLDAARATSFCAAADSVEPLRLVLNIPAARLDVLAAERLTRSRHDLDP